MVQSLSQVWLHLVFSTKDRKTYLQNADFQEEMFRMLSYEVDQIGCCPVQSGGWIDHVHVVCGLSRTMSVSKLVEHLKTETSIWAKKQSHNLSSFAWQTGYGAFSVSHSNLEKVIRYVQRQEEHHRRSSFQDEFRELCRKHAIEIDEQFVWG